MSNQIPDAPNTMVIEGRQVTVVGRRPPIQQRLDQLLAALFAISVRNDITPRGTSAECEVWRTHRFAVLREGRHLGLDGVIRDLRIEMCTNCGAACVRDVSYDRLSGLKPGRGGPARRDLILGWYSGARRANRQYT